MNIYAISSSSSMLGDTPANMGPSGEVMDGSHSSYLLRSTLPGSGLRPLLSDRVEVAGSRNSVQQLDELSRLMSTALGGGGGSGGNIPGPSARRLMHLQNQQQAHTQPANQPAAPVLPQSSPQPQASQRRLTDSGAVPGVSGRSSSDLRLTGSALTRPRSQLSPSTTPNQVTSVEPLDAGAVNESVTTAARELSRATSSNRISGGPSTVASFAKNVRGKST